MAPPYCVHCHKHIAAVIQYFERERNNRGPLLPLTEVQQRAADALGINRSSVSKVSKMVRSGQPLAGPSKPHRPKTVTNISEGQAAEIRSLIYYMHKEKQQVTLQTLNEQLARRAIFEGSKASLSRVLSRIGFKFKKDNNRRALMEFPYVRLQSTVFLRAYVSNLQATHSRQFVFLDETWIFENSTTSTSSWQDESPRSVRRIKVDGKRHIVLHAGGRQGFIEGAELVFSSKSTSADYHHEMNESNFLKWFEEQLLPNLEEPSLIVMDNASYHSTVANKVPNSNSLKADIQQWLRENNIPFAPEALKIDLWNVIQQ